MKAYKNITKSEDKELREAKMVKESLCGEIKFRKNRKLILINVFIKSMTYILVAALSGSIAGLYVSSIKSTEITSKTSTNNTPFLLDNKSEFDSSSIITKVASDVGQTVVSISNSDDGIFYEDNVNNNCGVIFKSDGYILTNYSGIKSSNKHMIKLSNGRNIKPVQAKVIGFDAVTDLAVLKIERKNLPVAVFGDSASVHVGNRAIAIGNNNGGLSSTVTAGIVSAFSRKKKVYNIGTGAVVSYNIIQTDAQINNSNIGGALCSDKGVVIGIIQKDEKSKNSYAIEIDDVQKIVDAIIKNSHVSRPYAGFSSEAYVSANKKQNGVLVKDIISGTGAEKAGIKSGDVIVEFDMFKVQSNDDINDIIQRHSTGDIVPCKILRGGKTISVKITLSETPANDG